MARVRMTKVPNKAEKMKLGEYVVVLTPEAREFVDTAGADTLDAIKTAAVTEPRELTLRELKIDGRLTLLVAFLNPFVKTAYVALLDEERLHSEDLTRERAIRTVSLGIGARPDLPPGDEYVDGIWRNLIVSG